MTRFYLFTRFYALGASVDNDTAGRTHLPRQMQTPCAKIMVPALALALAGFTLIACRNSARRTAVGGGATVETGFAQESSPATVPAGNEYRILDRGEDHSVFGKVTEYRTTNGTPFYVTNRYKVLENGLNEIPHRVAVRSRYSRSPG